MSAAGSKNKKMSPLEQERADQESAKLATEIFRQILKGLKNISIYRHAESRFNEYLQPAYDAMVAFLATEGTLPLKLSPYTLEFKKNVIYEEQSKENLTYKFYRDGMRFLVFREGLAIEELRDFLLLAIEHYSEDQLFQEDTITKLWKAAFQNIEYVVVESFEFEDMSPEEVEIEVEKVVAYLRKQLAANSDDITRFARLDVEDLALELSDVDQVRGGIISGRPATDNDKEYVQAEMIVEEKKRVFAKVVLILFQILERDFKKEDYDMIAEAFSQVLDALILAEDIRGCVAVVYRFDQIAAIPTLDPKHRQNVQLIRHTFVNRMSEADRLRAIGQYLMLAKELDEAAIKAYLSVIQGDVVGPLIELLEGIERAEARNILIDGLSVLGRDRPDAFADRLDHKSSKLVKDLLSILLKIDPPNKLEYFSRCFDHPNLMIRLEGLRAVAQVGTDAAMMHLEKAMDDSDLQMRLGAYRALSGGNPVVASPIFIKMMESEAYLNRDKREQIAIATALGETRTRDALQYFSGVFSMKGTIFQRSRLADLKQMAIIGLAALGGVHAFNLLAQVVKDRHQGKDVIEAAHKTALRLKEQLTQGAPRAPNQGR